MADLIDRVRTQTQAQATLDRYAAAHTAENFDRLQAGFAEHGWKLTGSLRSKVSFALHDPMGATMAGLALASVEDLFAQIRFAHDISGLRHPLRRKRPEASHGYLPHWIRPCPTASPGAARKAVGTSRLGAETEIRSEAINPREQLRAGEAARAYSPGCCHAHPARNPPASGQAPCPAHPARAPECP